MTYLRLILAIAFTLFVTACGGGLRSLPSTTVAGHVKDGRAPSDEATVRGALAARQVAATPLGVSCLGSGACSLNINAGGAAITGWDKDEDYGGPSYAKVTTAPIITTGVASPAPQAVYQSQRIATGVLKYTITHGSAPLGNFKVSLHFAELYFAAAGQRVFNVSINGKQVLSKFDVEAVAGGKNHALVKTFTGSTTTNSIVIEFTSVTNNPIVNGLQVEWGIPASSSSVTFGVVDYFTGASIAAPRAVVDGAAISGHNGIVTTPSLSAGLHQYSVTAGGYATYNGAIQFPAGATSRTIRLFPISSAMSAWLAQVNADRIANGAGTVALDDMLTIAAFDHAADMGVQKYFAHFDPHGFAPTTRSLLLGSMMMGSENIAAGYSTWTSAEAAFMAEKSSLPNKSPADCPQYDSLAGHYCNIVWPSHNWVGLAIAQVSGSPYALYYDQEFGDDYGSYDTSVVPREPPLGTSAKLAFGGANGATITYDLTASLPPPVPITTAELNADPTCDSGCPSADQWYPQNATFVNLFPLPLSFQVHQIYFGEIEVSGVSQIFVGFGAYSAAFAGGTVAPTEYSSAAYDVQTQSKIRSLNEPAGRIAPYSSKMRPAATARSVP